jgi:hypothetical protein
MGEAVPRRPLLAELMSSGPAAALPRKAAVDEPGDPGDLHHRVRSGAVPVAVWRDRIRVRRTSPVGRTFSDRVRARTYSARGSPARARGSAGRAAPGYGAWPRAAPHEAGARHDASGRDRRDHRHRRGPGRGARGAGRRRLDRRAGSRADLGDPGRAALVVAAALAAHHGWTVATPSSLRNLEGDGGSMKSPSPEDRRVGGCARRRNRPDEHRDEHAG